MIYCCTNCGYHAQKWLGRCPACQEWDSFAEEHVNIAKDVQREGRSSWIGSEIQPVNSIEVDVAERFSCGINEVDRILGGGLIAGSVILFGGEPGVGKSTLLLQIAHNLARNHGRVLYTSGEESPGQIKLRATRLKVNCETLYILSEQTIERIVAAVEEVDARVLIVDSIQTVSSGKDGGDPGGIRQVRQASTELIRLAKARRMSTFLVGHITKEGTFAGPKTIEHLVDTALYLEGSQESGMRILRSVKNRFGATDEIAVFQMGPAGMTEIADLSSFFLQKTTVACPGVAIVPIIEGTRPLLIEIQALVSSTGGYGIPQRRATGIDCNRILLMLAVIEKRLGIHVRDTDVYLNIAGGLGVREWAIDLGVVAAIVSSLRNKAMPTDIVLIGEIGLSGEVRKVKQIRERITEAAKLGYRRAIIPAVNQKAARNAHMQIDLIAVETVDQAMETLKLI
ncbi:DNA repair protein RadA [Candidatus Acetothermia bacterium]|jgi:DNA repair protein RadA/Sms|nr:DNA repair protein RadA [Candidatus Acetothermia bacterium]MCI2427077.1 DNA repair protein RadA [Candidatus Acetothermia bacterium]MCI2428602.1 DNA repair protein RadA [Candidatus Acetothermia bacterium]